MLYSLETPGITAFVTYKFDSSTVGYHQAIPKETMTWRLNSAVDAGGPIWRTIDASVCGEGGNLNPSEVLSIHRRTGRISENNLPGQVL